MYTSKLIQLLSFTTAGQLVMGSTLVSSSKLFCEGKTPNSHYLPLDGNLECSGNIGYEYDAILENSAVLSFSFFGMYHNSGAEVYDKESCWELDKRDRSYALQAHNEKVKERIPEIIAKRENELIKELQQLADKYQCADLVVLLQPAIKELSNLNRINLMVKVLTSGKSMAGTAEAISAKIIEDLRTVIAGNHLHAKLESSSLAVDLEANSSVQVSLVVNEDGRSVVVIKENDELFLCEREKQAFFPADEVEQQEDGELPEARRDKLIP